MMRVLAFLLSVLLLPLPLSAQTFGKVGMSNVSMGSTGQAAFIENLDLQVLATNGNAFGAYDSYYAGPAFCNNNIYLAYFTSGGAIIALQYRYSTGEWSSSTVDTGIAGGNNIHNAPSIFCFPTGHSLAGKIWIMYGGGSDDECAGSTAGPAPCHRTSTNANDISSWADRVVDDEDIVGAFRGGFDSSNLLHIANQTEALTYMTYDGAGDIVQVEHQLIQNPNENNVGNPACNHDIRVSGTNIDIMWQSGNCSGGSIDAYYARSTDGGSTFCNVSGGTCFNAVDGLPRTGTVVKDSESYNTYSCNYAIICDNSWVRGVSIGRLSNGNPIILTGSNNGTDVRSHTWSGSAWTTVVVDTGTPWQMRLQTLSSGRVIAHYMLLGEYVLWERYSDDSGATWSAATNLASAEASHVHRNLFTTYVAPAGQDERILISWTATNTDQKSDSKLKFLDRSYP